MTNYSGNLPQKAKVVITARSSQINAAVYCADLLNGENDITGLNVWDKAFPSQTMYNLSLSPMEVWGMLGSVPVPTGSYGEMITNSMFNSQVYLDVASIYSGTGWGIGTELTPVNNLTDALTILTNIGSSTIQLAGTLTLDQDVSGLEFISWKNGKIDLNNQPVLATRFKELNLFGTQYNSMGLFFDCRIANLQGLQGVFDNCRFLGTNDIAISSGTTEFFNCKTQAGAGEQTFIFPSGGTFFAKDFSGKVNFADCSNPATMCNFSFLAGMIEIESTVTAGMFLIMGLANTTDNSTGTAIVLQRDVAHQMWLLQKNTLNTSGSIGNHVRNITNKKI